MTRQAWWCTVNLQTTNNPRKQPTSTKKGGQTMANSAPVIAIKFNPIQTAKLREELTRYTNHKPIDLTDLVQTALELILSQAKDDTVSEESLCFVERCIEKRNWSQKRKETLIKKLYINTGIKPQRKLYKDTWDKLSFTEQELNKQIKRELKNQGGQRR